MSLPIYQRVAVTDAGDIIPGAEYTVINENTGVAAPIYSDRTGATLLTAPYFADSAGTIQFFIAQGTTFRVAASGGVGTYTDRYVYGVAAAVLALADGSATINRVGSDGSALSIQKDGTTVGSIGSRSGVVTYISSGGSYTGLDFASAINPMKSGVLSDAVADLGGVNNRFKDLYLSGGVVFGTGGPSPITSNTLDDYEEGTWTPTISGGTLTIATLWRASYTKIGNLVTIQFFVTLSNNGDGTDVIILGLPFTVSPNCYAIGGFNHSGGSDSTSTMYVRAVSADNRVFVYKGGYSQVVQTEIDGGSTIFSLTYQTNT